MNLLFAENNDAPDFRALTLSVAIEAAAIYASSIDDALGYPEESSGLLANLIERLHRGRQAAVTTEFFTEILYSYDRRMSEAGASRRHRLLLPLIDNLETFHRRYVHEILPRTLEPFAASLICARDREELRIGGSMLYLVSEWHGDSCPVDHAAVQFFEVVGLMMSGQSRSLGAILIDGEVRRALLRGRLTTPEPDGRALTDIHDLVRFLA